MNNKEICAGCNTEITDSVSLRCALCNKSYDLICANVSEQRYYNTLTGEHRKAWKCVCCISNQPKTDNTNTPVRGISDGVNLNRGAAACNLSQHLDDSNVLNDTAEITDLQSFLLEARQWREEWRATRVQLEIFNGVVGKLTQRLEESDQRCDRLQQRVESLESQVLELKSDHSESSLQNTIDRLKENLNDRDQELLANDVEISNIPEEKGENLVHIVTTLADKLCVDIAVQDIVSAARVGRSWGVTGGDTAAPQPRPIVARFVRRSVRDQLLQSARVRRGATTEGTGIPAPYRRFYINERLTKSNRILFGRARELGKSQNWRYVWTRDGKTFVRRHLGPDSPRHRIRNEGDLVRVFECDIVGPVNVQKVSQ